MTEDLRPDSATAGAYVDADHSSVQRQTAKIFDATKINDKDDSYARAEKSRTQAAALSIATTSALAPAKVATGIAKALSVGGPV